MANAPTPGWYPDPEKSGSLRWWNGNAWADHVPSLDPTPLQTTNALPEHDVPAESTQRRGFWKNKWVWIGVVSLLIIGGIANLGGAKSVEIPELSGKSAEEAKVALEELGFDVSWDKWFVSSRLDEFDVKSVDPASGTQVKEGSKVRLEIVESPEITAQEEAQDKAEEEAESAEKANREAEMQKSRDEVKDVEALWLANWGISSPSELLTLSGYDAWTPAHAVQPGWGGSTENWIEIQVNIPLDEEQTRRLGVNVLNFVGPDYPYIVGVTFTDSNGIDHNFNRRDAPLAGPPKIKGTE